MPKTSLLDEARQIERDKLKDRHPCRVELVMRQLNETDRQALTEALADNNITSPTIRKVLANRNIEIGEKPVLNHRKGECRCGKE